MAIFTKTKSEQHQKIEEFDILFSKMLNSEEYIPHKKFKTLIDTYANLFDELRTIRKSHVLNAYCKTHRIKHAYVLRQMEKFKNAQKLVDQKNAQYISSQLLIEKDYRKLELGTKSIYDLDNLTIKRYVYKIM